MSANPWTEFDNKILINWHELKHAGWATIAHKLKRKPQACAAQYARLKQLRHNKPIKSLAELHEARLTPLGKRREAERDARRAAAIAREEEEAARGLITSTYFGDPPPGWSAYDRHKRKGQHA